MMTSRFISSNERAETINAHFTVGISFNDVAHTYKELTKLQKL